MGMLGFVPFSGLRDHGGGGMSFDPNSPDYGVFRDNGVTERGRDWTDIQGLFDDWKYLLSGEWIGAGLDDFTNNVLPDLNERLEQTLDQGGIDEVFGNPNTSGSIPRNPVSPETLQYLNAELAKFYGMDRNTAYQEALSNTAYQRAVVDMQRAGLNPAAIFGNGRGSTAGGVGYVGSAGSAASFGSRSGSKLFSADDFGLIASLAGLATAVVTKKPHNFWLGQQGAQAVMTTLNALDKKFK